MLHPRPIIPGLIVESNWSDRSFASSSVPVTKVPTVISINPNRGAVKYSSEVFLLPPFLPTLQELKLKLGFGPSLSGKRGYIIFIQKIWHLLSLLKALYYHQLFLSERVQDYPDHFTDAETDTNSKGNRGRKRGDRKHLGGTGRQLKRNKPKRK